MTYPYGKRERLKLVWEDACKSSNVKLVKSGVVFEGTGKYCGEQTIRWLCQKKLIDPIDILKVALKLDIRLFGTLWGMWEEEKNNSPAVETKPIFEESPGM